MQDRFGVSERRGCAAPRFHRSSQRTRAHRDDQAPLRLRIGEIAAVRVRYGYPRIHILLRREGWAVNRKRVDRLYRLRWLKELQIAEVLAETAPPYARMALQYLRR